MLCAHHCAKPLLSRWLLARVVQVLGPTPLSLLEAVPATPSSKWHLNFPALAFRSLTYASGLPVYSLSATDAHKGGI